MKQCIYALAVYAACCVSSVAQTAYPVPEFSGRVYAVSQDSALSDLERADANVDFKLKGAGSETSFAAFGARSSVRFSKSALPVMLIKVDNGGDPADLVLLSVGKVLKDRRRFVQSSMSMTGKARDVGALFVQVSFTKVQDGLYQVVLPSDIPAGEYAFMPIASKVSFGSSIKISCFGIDVP